MALPRINFTETPIALFQDNVDRALTPLQNMPMVNGTVISDVVLTSGQDNLVRHGLDHTPQYFIVVKIQVSSTVWSPNTSTLNNTNADRTNINLRCSTTCTVSVWVN